jgi:hypothetical protein
MGDEIRVTVIATGFERSGVPRRALEHLTTRNEKPASLPTHFIRSSESVSVGADFKQTPDTKSGSAPRAHYGSDDDLDIPTFLRNRR